MKRGKIQTRPAKAPPPANTTISPQPRDVDNIAVPPANGLLNWLVLAAILGIGLGSAFMFSWAGKEAASSSAKASTQRERWKPARWEPRTAEELLIDQFVKLRLAGDKKAFDLLGPAPVFDKKPVSEQTAAALQTDFFLRGELVFKDIWRGEPDGKGAQRAVPGRFTLVTKGHVSSPRLSVRTEKGVDPPSQLMMANPDLVVEVRDGKIHGLRAELHMGP